MENFEDTTIANKKRRYAKSKKLCESKYGFKPYKIVIFIIFAIFVLLLWVWNQPKSLPPVKIYFNHSFSEGIGNWIYSDAFLKEDEDLIKLEQRNKATAPHLMHSLLPDESPSGSFIWSITARVSAFTNKSAVLGALITDKEPLVLVVDFQGKLGITRGIEQQPQYSATRFSRLAFDNWENINIYVNNNEKSITVYLNGRKILKESLTSTVCPIKQIYLGNLWLQGEGNYGIPFDISYRQTYLSNEGMLPQPTFAEFLINNIESTFSLFYIFV